MGLLRTIIRTATRPARKKVHGVSGERKVNATLGSLSNRNYQKQISNLIILDVNGKSHQIDQIVIRKNGIFCIETKNFIGWIFGDESSTYWKQTLNNGQEYRIYNPIKQNNSHCYYLSKIIKNKYKINSIVVMANNNANRIRTTSSIVINLSTLSKYLNQFNDGTYLTTSDIDEIYNRFMSCSSGLTNAEHIQNVRKTKAEIARNICPRCGGKLVLRSGVHGSFYGCSNYPKCNFVLKK